MKRTVVDEKTVSGYPENRKTVTTDTYEEHETTDLRTVLWWFPSYNDTMFWVLLTTAVLYVGHIIARVWR